MYLILLIDEYIEPLYIGVNLPANVTPFNVVLFAVPITVPNTVVLYIAPSSLLYTR